MKNTYYVSIIIANFNGEKYLYNCLTSVLATKYKNYELIIIDDGSTDNSLKIIERFRKNDSRIRVLKNEINLGAAASRNKAIAKSGGEIVVFLDNDTQVTAHWLENLVEPFSDNNVGGTQSLMLDFENRDIIQMAGGLLIPSTGWLMPFFQGKSYEKIKNEITRENIIAISASLAVRKKVLAIIGDFDEKEAVHTEDLDFTWRIWIAGYKVVLAHKSVAFHYSKSVSERKNMHATFESIYYHLAKNSFRSILKNYEATNVIRYLFLSLMINFGRGIMVLIKRKDSSALSGSVKALYWNIKNIPDTLQVRSEIQSSRKVADQILFRSVFDTSNLTAIYKKQFRSSNLLNI